MGPFPTMARSGGNPAETGGNPLQELCSRNRPGFCCLIQGAQFKALIGVWLEEIAEMKIVDVKAYPTSYRVPKERQVSLGIGTMTKRDCVMVKVTTEDGLVGWGESHHARSPGSIGHLINTTLKGFVVGMDATDTTGIWARIYKFQLGSHGMGAATAMAMSGIDQALWD